MPDGSYTLQSLVTDQASNTAYSTGVSVIVDNTPPTTAVIVPASGAGLHGSTSLDASASDNVSVKSVQFVISGGSYNKTVIAHASLTGYGYYSLWNTRACPMVPTRCRAWLLTRPATHLQHGCPGDRRQHAADDLRVGPVEQCQCFRHGGHARRRRIGRRRGKERAVRHHGGAYTKAVVGTAAATYYGYIYQWNTTTVPDGSYTLQSLATDNAGNTTYSSGITIKVTN